VTDDVTTRHDAYLRPFQVSVDAGVPAVMVSLAYYRRIDPARPAVFSPVVIGSVLRGDLGFRGVVVSDDLANARQVAAWRPGARAVRFLAAGGDVVLTVDPRTLPAMYAAVLGRARHDAGFRAEVDAAALRVLTLKQHRGLL
jgi:beta-N-acetylhexosaminidase